MWGYRQGTQGAGWRRQVTENCIKHRGRPKTGADAHLRKLIAEEAGVLFLQKGYGATTTEEIAARCKISKQTLYRLFSGKSALFAAVVELKRPQWLNLPAPEHLPMQAALEAVFRINIGEDEERERMQFLEMMLAEGRLYPELSEILKNRGSSHAHQVLADWMQRQANNGLIELAGTALSTAYLLTDMVFGSLFRRTIGEGTWGTGEAWRAHVRIVVRVFLCGAGQREKAATPPL